MIIGFDLFFALVGFLVYMFFANQKLVEIGRLL